MPDQKRESPFPTRVEGFCKRLLVLSDLAASQVENPGLGYTVIEAKIVVAK
jgi:hypothetical protein